MTPRAAAALALLALAGAAAGCGDGRGRDRILVATEAAYPPFESRGPDGEIRGFDIDLVRAAAREAGLGVEFVDQPFDGIIPGLVQGKYDAAVSAISITPERAAVVDFTDPYYDAGQVIAVREGETGIAGLADLEGRTIAVQISTTGNRAASAVEGATVKTFPSVEPAFMELLAGRADAVINDHPTTLLYLREHPGLKVVGGRFTEERYGIAVRRGNAALLGRLNAGLARVRASGEYGRLQEKWIGGEGR